MDLVQSDMVHKSNLDQMFTSHSHASRSILFYNKFITTKLLNIIFRLKFLSTKLKTYGFRSVLNNQTNKLRVITNFYLFTPHSRASHSILFYNKFLTIKPLNITFRLKFLSTKLKTYGFSAI